MNALSVRFLRGRLQFGRHLFGRHLFALAACVHFISGCAGGPLRDDPTHVGPEDAVAYIVVKSETRIRQMYFRSADGDRAAGIFNLEPGTSVGAFNAPAGSYCLQEISVVGMSGANPDGLFCFDLQAGELTYLGRLELRGQRIARRALPDEDFQRFATAYPNIAKAFSARRR